MYWFAPRNLICGEIRIFSSARQRREGHRTCASPVTIGPRIQAIQAPPATFFTGSVENSIPPLSV